MTPVLFPELAEPEAARAPEPVPASRELDLKGLGARTALVRQKAPQGGKGRWFDWSANPYRGCEFGCDASSGGYCCERYSHEFLGHSDPKDFERSIYVKEGFVDALRRDLRRRVKRREHIAFGTATDPYQPIEKRERVTFRALSALLDAEGLRISITTKSTLVGRDAKLLVLLAERHAVHVNVSLTTPDERLARFLEPRAPAPDRRFATIARLREHGIEAGVFLMPLLPGITDAEQDVERLMKQAAAAGARWLGSQVVFLREPSRSHFLRGLKRSYPRVAARYAWWTRYDGGGCAGGRFPENIRDQSLARVRRLAARHGLSSRPDLDLPAPRRSAQGVFDFSAPPG
jgi:DNA repair photolyase